MKWLCALSLFIAGLAGASVARADPLMSSAEESQGGMGLTGALYASRKVCAPGAQVACSCASGGRGTSTCDPTGVRFSLCACASVTVNVPQVAVPQVVVPNVEIRRRKRGPTKRYSGLGMLIAGSIVTSVGVPNLWWGVRRVRESAETDAPGILSIVHGGLCIATGLPLMIVGAVLLGTRGLNPPDEPAEARSGPLFALTPTGFGVQF